MASAMRLRYSRLDDLFGDLDETRPLSLVDNDEQHDGDAEPEGEPQDRRDIAIHIPGRSAVVLPSSDFVEQRSAPAPVHAHEHSATIDVDTPPAFTELYDPPLGAVRYRVFYGGRGSAKSWQIARALLVLGRTRPLRILCAREYQSSIKDSVHKLLSDQIDALTLRAFYTVQERAIVGRNGTEFIFKGIKKDISSKKSIEGIDLCWVEEAEAVSKHSWQTLTPTIRKPGSEIWVSFNPALETDDTYQRFVVKPPPAERAIIRKVTYRENPWLPEVLRNEEQDMLAADPEAHANVWDGEPWTRSDAQVLAGKWRVAEFTPQAHWGDPLFGADYGFANDPAVLDKLWVADSRLYLEYAEGGPQMDLDDMERAWELVPGAKRYTIRADAARPETTHELRKRGFKVISAPKWTGSVEDGIAHLRSYTEIVIHPRCKRAIQEARLWRYKVDPRTQDVLPKLHDGNDHTWDAARYGLAPMIRQRPKRDGDRSRSRSLEVA